MNWFVFSQISSLLDLSRNGVYYSLLVLATFSYSIAYTIENRCNNLFSKIVYAIASVWMGILGICFAILPIVFFVGLFVEYQAWFGYTVISIIATIALFSFCYAIHFRTKKIEIVSKKVKDKIRIIHLSDIHLGPIHKQSYLKKVVEESNKQNPDYVMISGDLIDGPGMLPKDIVKDLDKIKSPVYYSVGNHERYVGMDVTKDIIKNTQVKLLSGKSTIDKDIQIIGIDDADNKKQVEKELPKIALDKNKFTVLLYHRPQGLEVANKHGVDLMLSGHTHNGQIFPFNLLTKKQFPRITGLYDYKGSKLYVSPGTGTWGPPMRLGSRSEVTVIDIVPLGQ